MDTTVVKTDNLQSTSVNPDISQNTSKTNTPTLLIKNHKEPQLITLKAVDWNAARLWQRIQNGGDRMFPE
jgi:hypothetical protein